MAKTPSKLQLESWLDAAIAGATGEEVCDDDGDLVGWWAENSECPGASAYGATPGDAHDKLRGILAGWVELGHELCHPIPSFPEGEIAVTA